MIRYFDASALVKRYVHEQGSASVKRWLKTGAPATCRLTEAEISAALARRVREGDLTIEQRMTALRLLHADRSERAMLSIWQPPYFLPKSRVVRSSWPTTTGLLRQPGLRGLWCCLRKS